MSLLLQKAIVATVIYGDIFEYPLTNEEINKWLIGMDYKQSIEDKILNKIKNLCKKDNYYFLKNREKTVRIRQKREKYSREKLRIAQKVVNLLKFIPSIKMIGITGALAVNNVKKNDDIDLLVITSRGLLWTTRLLITLFTEITGRRRHPDENNIDNKICLNMFIDEDNLEVFRSEQDLFSAHEVLQMKPLFDRDNTYQKFLDANQWVKRYLPNTYRSIILNTSGEFIERSKHVSNYLITQLLNYLEFFFKKIQLWYMRNRRTTEVIKKGIIRFHPQDARKWVMEKYWSKLPS